MLYSKVLYLFLLLFSVSASATGLAKHFSVDQHIVINRFRSVSPRHICHDNVYIYFKSKEDCIKSDYSSILCEENLKLTPVREIEKIYLNDKEGNTLLRSYKVDLNYKTFVYKKTENKQYVLQDEETISTLSFCKNLKLKKEKVIYSERDSYGETEEVFLRQLPPSDVFWISTGPGPIHKIKQIDDSAFGHDKVKLGPSYLDKNIKSPQCSEVIPNSLVWKLSGEISGNGITKAKFDFIESNSNQIYKVKPFESSNLHNIKFGCEKSSVEI